MEMSVFQMTSRAGSEVDRQASARDNSSFEISLNRWFSLVLQHIMDMTSLGSEERVGVGGAIASTQR